MRSQKEDRWEKEHFTREQHVQKFGGRKGVGIAGDATGGWCGWSRGHSGEGYGRRLGGRQGRVTEGFTGHGKEFGFILSAVRRKLLKLPSNMIKIVVSKTTLAAVWRITGGGKNDPKEMGRRLF